MHVKVRESIKDKMQIRAVRVYSRLSLPLRPSRTLR
jgi:hypothetical protein